MTTIYKMNYTLGIGTETVASKIISGAEAKNEGISTKCKKVASIEDLYQDFNAGNGMFTGKVKVAEGVFEFDYDSNQYVQVV